jgi:hypothetical protein
MELLVIRLLDHASRKLNITKDLFILDFISQEELTVTDVAFLVSKLQVNISSEIKLLVPDVEEDDSSKHDKTITQGLRLLQLILPDDMTPELNLLPLRASPIEMLDNHNINSQISYRSSRSSSLDVSRDENSNGNILLDHSLEVETQERLSEPRGGNVKHPFVYLSSKMDIHSKKSADLIERINLKLGQGNTEEKEFQKSKKMKLPVPVAPMISRANSTSRRDGRDHEKKRRDGLPAIPAPEKRISGGPRPLPSQFHRIA